MLVAHRPDAPGRRARRTLPHHRRARRVRGHRPPLPRPGDGGRRPSSPGGSHEAHRRRLLGLLPRPGLAGQLLPARGRRRRAAAPGGCCSTSATAPSARCTGYVDPLDVDAVAPQPPARRPLPRPVRLLRAAQLPPRRARSRGSRCGGRRAPPTGWRAPTTCRPTPGMTEEFDFRAYDGAGRARTVRGRADPGRAPGRRRSACGSAPTARPLAYSGDTGPCDGARRVARDADLFLAEASFRQRRRQPAGPAPHRRRVRRGRHPRGSAGWCSPTSRPGTTRALARSLDVDGPTAAFAGPLELRRSRRAATLRTSERASRQRRSDQAGVVHDRSRSAPGW